MQPGNLPYNMDNNGGTDFVPRVVKEIRWCFIASVGGELFVGAFHHGKINYEGAL